MIGRVFATAIALSGLCLVALLALLLVADRLQGLEDGPFRNAHAAGTGTAVAGAAARSASARTVFRAGKRYKKLYLTVGTTYADPAARRDPVRATCWAMQDRQGLDPRIVLATDTPANGPRPLTPPKADREALGLTADDLARARAQCPWPAGI